MPANESPWPDTEAYAPGQIVNIQSSDGKRMRYFRIVDVSEDRVTLYVEEVSYVAS